MLSHSMMQIEALRRPFTVDEYDRMLEVGILGKEDHVELIEGEILEMSPIGWRHAACVDRATALLVLAFAGKAIVRPRGPIQLGDYTKPQPDLILLEPRKDYYASKGPVTRDAQLVIEVSDKSIRYDRGPKLRVYARHGVSEVWIEDLTSDTLLVFREPSGATYKTELALRRGESIAPLAFPEVAFSVSEFLGLGVG
jgi:Uma2 family endonuclease